LESSLIVTHSFMVSSWSGGSVLVYGTRIGMTGGMTLHVLMHALCVLSMQQQWCQ
jgi:hypothetical protein